MIFRRRNHDSFNNRSFMDVVTSPLRWLTRMVSRQFQSEDTLVSESQVGGLLKRVLTFPFRLLVGIFVFMVQAWASSRPGFCFVRAIPAMMFVGIYFIGLLVADYVSSERRVLAANKGYFNHHLNLSSDNPEYAEWFAKRLIDFKPEDDSHKYRLGLAYEKGGRMTEALDVIQYVSPEDHAGFSDGHVWLSQYYFQFPESENPLSTTQDIRVLRHLEFAVEANPENLFAQFRLASFHFQESKTDGLDPVECRQHLATAKTHLETVLADRNAEELTVLKIRAIPLLVDVRQKLGEDVTQIEIRNDINQLMLVAMKNAQVFEIWEVMVKIAVLVEDFPKASEVVQTGFRAVKTREEKNEIQKLGALVFIRSANQFTDMSKFNQFKSRYNQLCMAVDLGPTQKMVSLELLKFVQPEGLEPTDSESVDANDAKTPKIPFQFNEAWLHDAVANTSPNSADAVAHALIGLRRISEGKILEGENHWRIALNDKNFPYIYLVINNLINAAALRPEGEFSNLAEMMDKSIEIFPDHPMMYLTRGRYLKKSGLYEEAIDDFLIANEKTPMLEAFQQLIQCYEHLGDEQKADEQRQLLENILSTMDETTRERIEKLLKRLEY